MFLKMRGIEMGFSLLFEKFKFTVSKEGLCCCSQPTSKMDLSCPSPCSYSHLCPSAVRKLQSIEDLFSLESHRDCGFAIDVSVLWLRLGGRTEEVGRDLTMPSPSFQ